VLLAPQFFSSTLGIWVLLITTVALGVPLGALAGQLVWVLMFQGLALFSDMLTRDKQTEDLPEPRSAISRQVSAEVVKEALATPDGFQVWLKGKPADAVVGHCQILDSSPLANYLWEEATLYVDTAHDIIVYRKQETALSPWAVTFHQGEIEEGKRRGRELGDEWTAREALTMLAEALGRLHET
jgi:hypothetical protein